MPISADSDMLSGYRVLDLSQYLPGPFATRQMADLGADVIKIEPPHGDPMRQFLCSEKGKISPLYNHLNRGKRILKLDLKTDQGKEKLADLIKGGDVLFESFRPGVLERLGFGQTQLQSINPKLVHCALSGFGQSGPYKDRAGHDLTYCAAAGILTLTGTSDKPVMTYPPVADHAGAMQAVNAVLSALLKREKSGKGSYLDISLFESALSWQQVGLNEKVPERQALMLNGGAAYYNIYATKEGRYIALAALEPKFWNSFCKSVNREEWIDRQHESLPQQQLIGELEKMFLQQPIEHWNECLLRVDCCYEPIPTMDELSTHPQVEARQFIQNNELGSPVWVDGEAVKPEEAFAEIDATGADWL